MMIFGVGVPFLRGDPLFGLKGDIHEGLEVVETERGAVMPGTGLILEWPRGGRCEEWSVLTDVLPGRGFDVAAAQRGRWSFG